MHGFSIKRTAALAGSALCAALLAGALPQSASHASGGAPIYLPQWSAAQRQAFYTQDQGSQLIPLAWLRALRHPDGTPFLADQLARYGYLANPQSPQNLPVGFTVNGKQGEQFAGMTCAACHTREIDVNGQPYRIDGGPAISDFQSFLTDLVGAVGRIDADPAAFAAFSADVLGPNASAADRAALKTKVGIWSARESTMVARALPHAEMWGPGRLDAISMIFNRLTGLDIGPAPTYVIADNIKPADAPVRYPFIWNAPRQDHTQWPGFADNGDNLLGLARNLGEVYGVFGTMHPEPSLFRLSRVEFMKGNSANFDGLGRLENLVSVLAPPPWPWAIDSRLQARGAQVFAQNCAGCHGEAPGAHRLGNWSTWKTPVVDVGTDVRQYAILGRTASTGVLNGARVPVIGPDLKGTARQIDMLKVSVLDTILQGGLLQATPQVLQQHRFPLDTPAVTRALDGAFRYPPDPAQPKKYESRVLHGIWATAPYLHNGSVPTLADLLKPAAQRPGSFAVGRNYDLARVGLAAAQPGNRVRVTTLDCTRPDSGNSRCGHEGPGFGTALPEADKAALLEYLKAL